MIYYIDPAGGSASADGSSPANARASYTDIDIAAGDTVLFKRGSFIRGSLYRKPGSEGKPVTYGAYGEGLNPVFCGSVDVSSPSLWSEIRPNVWKYSRPLNDEACNFIFDNGRIGATLRWSENELAEQGDWFDSCMGMRESRSGTAEQKLLLYSIGNPGSVYSHIECAVWGRRSLSANVNYTVCQDLCFFGSGVHALSGGADHMTVKRCSFCFIGGAVWNRQLRIRFGNAVEFWEHCEDVLIEDCYFNNIYDSAITHQGSGNCESARRLVMRRNLFINYGMGAYEGRDRMSVDSSFCGNICLFAGGGFSGFGDTKPRKSEIFPQPMGHHIFMWRIPKAAENGSFVISGNLFHEAAGAAVYSIISDEAEAQMKLSGNRYFTSGKSLLTKIGGKSYAPDEFDLYLREYGEPSAEYAGMDSAQIETEVSKWFAQTGCGRCGEKLFTDKLPKLKYFIGSTTENSLSYSAGDEICFKTALVDEDGVKTGCPLFKFERSGDDNVLEKGTVPGGSGEFVYRTSLKSAGYVYLSVTPCDENGNALPNTQSFYGGACAGFAEIKRVGNIPDDYDLFWNRVAETELDPVFPKLLEKKEFRCGDPDDAVYDVKIACPGKYPVSGYIRIPRAAAAKSLPITVSFSGYNVTSAPVPAKADAIQLAVNQHGILNGQSPEYYENLLKTEFAGFGFDRTQNADPDTVYFKYMVLRAVQAVRYCKTLPEWDGVNIKVSGGSMGAFQAVSAAAHEHSVTELNILIPWLCDLHGVECGRITGWRPEPDTGLDYYDTAVQASRVECPVKISAGLGDYLCPPSGITALYHAFNAPAELEMVQNRTHSFYPPVCDSYKLSK